MLVSLRPYIKKMIGNFDGMLSKACLPLTNERGTLLSLVFHALFQSRSELEAETHDPQQGITVEMFRRIIDHFRRESYVFTTPEVMIEDLSPTEKYVLLTFDDGYYNNVRALPILEEFEVPAVFCVSSDHVGKGKAFWWDVLYRECRKRGRSHADIRKAVEGLKHLRTTDVESKLREEFGESALTPVGELDRPFTARELRDFAKHRLVHLGNHTKDHAILTNYSRLEVREQIRGGQEGIQEMTGKTPRIIAYPNGNATPEIWEAARDLGLQLGVLARGGKNRLPLASGSPTAMTLKRFQLWGNWSIESQCRACRSDLSLFRLLKRLDRGARTHSFSPISA